MMNETVDFLTERFYNDPVLTLNILNELDSGLNHIADKDMYGSGEWLFMEAYENEATKNILSPVIKDLEAYKQYNNEKFTADETTQIGLCALQHLHTKHFDWKFGIVWDNENQEFDFNKNMSAI